jgi:hypothetical protein
MGNSLFDQLKKAGLADKSRFVGWGECRSANPNKL